LDIFSIQDKRVPIAVGIIIGVGVGVGIGIDPDPDSDPDTDAVVGSAHPTNEATSIQLERCIDT
jgi:hypothetical protein